MDMDKAVMMRFVFSRIKVHPAWNQENREALMDLFGLDEEHLDALHDFTQWVNNHELEYLLEQK